MRIETERLILRGFEESDYDDLYEYLSQLEDDEFEGYPGITYENCKDHMAYRVGSEEFYAIEVKDTGKVIGNIYCGNRDFEAKEVGYIVNKNYRRCGYAREALCAVIENAFHTGTHRVYAECDPRNTGSWRLLESAGLQREAYFHKNVFFHKDENGMPIWKDTYVYALVNNAGSVMTNTEIVSAFFQEGYERQNYDVVMNLLAEDYIDHSPAGAKGNAQAVEILKIVAKQFSELSIQILDNFCENEMVATRVRYQGVHSDTCMGIPATGKRISFEALENFRVVDGKIVESWGYWPDKEIEEKLRNGIGTVMWK